MPLNATLYVTGSVMAIDKLKANIKQYSFPCTEKLISCQFESGLTKFELVLVARPIDSAPPTSFEEFWVSGFYNCLEDVDLDYRYDELINLTNPVELSNLKEIESIFTGVDGTFFVLDGLVEGYKMLSVEKIESFIGKDSKGVFVVVGIGDV